MYFVPEKHTAIKHRILQFGVGGKELSRQHNVALKCSVASLRYSGSIQSVFLILLITQTSNGMEYTHVSVINNMYLEEMDLVLATT